MVIVIANTYKRLIILALATGEYSISYILCVQELPEAYQAAARTSHIPYST